MFKARNKDKNDNLKDLTELSYTKYLKQVYNKLLENSDYYEVYQNLTNLYKHMVVIFVVPNSRYTMKLAVVDETYKNYFKADR